MSEKLPEWPDIENLPWKKGDASMSADDWWKYWEDTSEAALARLRVAVAALERISGQEPECGIEVAGEDHILSADEFAGFTLDIIGLLPPEGK